MKRLLKRIVPGSVRRFIRRGMEEPQPFSKQFFSQEGEDALLFHMFRQQDTGFYVDVGAHHPQRFSNTYTFYLRGWQGINIDPRPGMAEEFNRARPRDVNLEVAVSNVAGAHTYYEFNLPELNGFDNATRIPGAHVVNTREVKTVPLRDILKKHVPANVKTIHFLSIDVEGHEMEVVASNDWATYRPIVVIAEARATLDLATLFDAPLTGVLKQYGYHLYGKLYNSVFFLRDDITEKYFLYADESA